MTASRPGRPILLSLSLVAGIATLSLAAARAPAPPRPALPNADRVRAWWRGGDPSVARHTDPPAATRIRPPLAVSRKEAPGRGLPARASTKIGSEPARITVEWENAPIATVAAAFAAFSRRVIKVAEGVTGSVSAAVHDERWDVALRKIMTINGYRVLVTADSSILITSAREARSGSGARPPQLNGAFAFVSSAGGETREITGSVVDDGTGAPIVGAEIHVIGVQAIGESNRACTDGGGVFRMRVPDGEVWLDAAAPGYDFRRITLDSGTAVANFRGRAVQSAASARFVLSPNDTIESVNVLKGAAAALYGPGAANGVIVITTKRGERVMRQVSPAYSRIGIDSTAATPLIIIDGAVVGRGAPRAADSSCAASETPAR